MQLIISNLSKSFGKKQVLKHLSWTFQQGSVYALLGRNGAGKTTLFSLIAEEYPKDEGEVFLQTDTERRKLEADDIFFMISEPTLPTFLTGREFLQFFIDVNKDRISEMRSLDSYFEQIDFAEEDRDRLINEYSTGMKNKLQMLMFLILRPPVILMDEPLTSLDVVVQLEMKRLIRSIQSSHIILFSTHILQLAKDLCDEIVLLHDGALEEVDRDILNDEDFEAKVIQLLSSEVIKE